MTQKLKIDLDIAKQQEGGAHGQHAKDQVVLHETVSPNYPGLADIESVSHYLGTVGYAIHGITDNDGNIAWALGCGNDIFWHCAGGDNVHGWTNDRSIGIEQISRVMVDFKTVNAEIAAWAAMAKEIDATAKLLAAIVEAHPDIPLVRSRGMMPGITTHWDVTHAFQIYGGHTDGWPIGEGGYYPLDHVIALAREYRTQGYHF
jgi:hypothetical protein